MPTTKEIVGTWFPTGYYGHVRSKPRSDFVCEYRQLAKPQPPGRFVARSLRGDTRHPFSLHDNRNSFVCDAIYFEQGLGKRKIPGKACSFDPDFTTWMPLKQEIARSLPHVSTYQGSYTRNGVPQMLAPKPMTSCLQDPANDTTYHFAYGKGCTHQGEVLHNMQQAMRLSTTSRNLAAIRNPRPPRESVASCLNWHRGKKLAQVQAAPPADVLVSNDLTHLPPVPAPTETERPELNQTVSSQPASTQTASHERANSQTVCPPQTAATQSAPVLVSVC